MGARVRFRVWGRISPINRMLTEPSPWPLSSEGPARGVHCKPLRPFPLCGSSFGTEASGLGFRVRVRVWGLGFGV